MQTHHFYKKQDSFDKKIAYVNARIVDPSSGFDSMGELLTIGDKIADFGSKLFPDSIPQDIEVIDCGGMILCPGLIDIQVHLREPGFEYKEDIETGSRAAAAGGVTTMVCMANTNPPIDDVTVLEYINKQAKERSLVNIRAYATITKGMKGEHLTEMARLKSFGAVGFSDDGLPVMNSLVMRRAMEYAKDIDMPISQHAEDINLSDGGAMNEGEISAKLGIKGVPNASEAIIVERDILLNKLVGGRYHVLHISTAEAIDAVRRAKARGQKVTCEVAPHHFTLTDEAMLHFNTNAKMNPPLRREEDRKILIEALIDGTIDAIATDHAPHDHDSKCNSVADAPFGILGLETMLPLSLALYHRGHLSLSKVLGLMTYKASDILNLDRGRIAKGAIADLTLIDENLKWKAVNNDFHSKSKNTPFEGMMMQGKAIRTISSGQTVCLYSE